MQSRRALKTSEAGAGPVAAAGLPDRRPSHKPAAAPDQGVDDAPIEGRWSKRATLAFILISCGGFWLVAAIVAVALLRH